MRAYIILYWTCYLYLMMLSYSWQMVRTRSADEAVLDLPETSAGRGRGQLPRAPPRGQGTPPPPPRPPVSLEQLLATQNDLMRRLVENDERRGMGRQQHPRQ